MRCSRCRTEIEYSYSPGSLPREVIFVNNVKQMLTIHSRDRCDSRHGMLKKAEKDIVIAAGKVYEEHQAAYNCDCGICSKYKAYLKLKGDFTDEER